MKLTIITSDNLVSIDGLVQIFDYSALINSNVWAVQWDGSSGSEEIIDVGSSLIENLDNYQLVIDEFYTRDSTVNIATEIVFGIVQVIYLSERIDTMTTSEADASGIVFTPISLESALTTKESEIDIYANLLIDNAFSNPTIDQTDINPRVQRNIMSVRRNDKSDKLAGEITLTQEEKDESKTDQKLSEYELKINQDSDKAKVNVNKLNTVVEVVNFDISAESWNVWNPPV